MEDQAYKKELADLTKSMELLFQGVGATQKLEKLKLQKRESEKPWLEWLKRWHKEAEPGVSSAVVVSTAALTFGRQYTVPFWWSLCLFPLVNPIYAKSIFTVEVVPLFYDREQEYTIEEANEGTAGLYVLSGYVGWLFGLQLLVWSVYVEYFFFEHPLFTCTLFSIVYLVSRQKSWFEYGRVSVRMDALPFVLDQWMGNFYNRVRIRFWKWIDWLSYSIAIRFCKFFVRRVLVFILWQPNFDKLGKFEYRDLDIGKREVRLLRIHRRIPFCDLKCALVHVSLDEAEPYQAISYCWGEQKDKGARIILDNKKFAATSTVYEILHRRSSIFASRLIWIDSICINQNDNTEKGDQVRLMTDIYKTASRVLVCLGDAPNARLGISMVHELVLLNDRVGYDRTALAKHILGYSHRIDNGDELLKPRLTGLLDLLHHPWFGRIWIIQEVVVAKSLTVLYSNYELIWDYLILFMELLATPEMSEIQSQKCPRDKIFALLGIAEPSPGILELIDYDKTLSEALYDVAKYLYFQEGTLLAVLQFAGIGWDGVEPGCPSWVPNWTIIREPTTLAQAAGDMVDHRIQYCTATQMDSQISFLPEARLIKVRGQKLDKIKAISIVPTDFLPNRQNVPVKEMEEFCSWLENAELFAERHCGNTYPWPVGEVPAKQSIHEAFWRTLMGDRTQFARPAPPAYAEHFAKFLSYISQFRTLVKKYDGNNVKLRDVASQPSSYKNNFGTVEEFMAWQRDLNNANWLFGQPGFPRNFCVTEKGLMGMVPKYSKIGDDICLIYGAQVPFVLRATSEGGEMSEQKRMSEERNASHYEEPVHELVGECYMHGMMDGEGLNLGNWEGGFTIR
ncbi:HET domain containing protein [Hyaloscypha variabilis]